MVLSTRSGKQITNSAMGTADIPTTQESSHVEMTDEDNAHSISRVLVHFEFISQGRKINQAYSSYVEILKRLQEVMLRKRHEFWPTDWIIPSK
jgi:hypothetical protein